MNLNFSENRIYRFFIAVELFCTGALLLRDVGGRMAGMSGMEVPLMNGIHILFVLLFISLSLINLRNPEAGSPGSAEPESEKGGENTRLETHYYHITIVLALTAVISIMEPNLIGFMISLIEYVFFGLPLRLGIKFFHMDIPLIVRISLCIADAAIALTLFCLVFYHVTGVMFKERHTVINRLYDDDPEDTPPQGS